MSEWPGIEFRLADEAGLLVQPGRLKAVTAQPNLLVPRRGNEQLIAGC